MVFLYVHVYVLLFCLFVCYLCVVCCYFVALILLSICCLVVGYLCVVVVCCLYVYILCCYFSILLLFCCCFIRDGCSSEFNLFVFLSLSKQTIGAIEIVFFCKISSIWDVYYHTNNTYIYTYINKYTNS